MSSLFSRKKYANKLHLYFGLLLALPLLIICFTGAMLSYQEEFCHILYPQQYQNQWVDKHTKIEQSTAQIIETISKEKNINRVFFPNKHRQTLAIMLEGEDYYRFYNSKTGSYQASMHNLRGIFKPALILHRTFFWREGGNLLVGIICFVFWLVILFSGIFLFIPKRWHIAQFKIRRKAFSLSSHRVLGFFFLLPLLILGITGNYFTYSEPYNKIISLFTDKSPKVEQKKLDLGNSHDSDLSMLELYACMQKKKADLPSRYQNSYIMRSSSSTRPVSVSFEDFESTIGIPDRQHLYLHPKTGAVLKQSGLSDYSSARKTAFFIVYLHMGKVAGWPLKLLWCLSGLVGSWFCISGIRIWWLKSKF